MPTGGVRPGKPTNGNIINLLHPLLTQPSRIVIPRFLKLYNVQYDERYVWNGVTPLQGYVTSVPFTRGVAPGYRIMHLRCAGPCGRLKLL